MTNPFLLNVLQTLFLGAAVLAGPSPGQEVQGSATTPRLIAEDRSNGAGGEISINLSLPEAWRDVEEILIERAPSPAGAFSPVGRFGPGPVRFNDSDVLNGVEYYYRARIFRTKHPVWTSPVFGPAASTALWFKPGALFTCIFSCFVILVMLFFLFLARRGRSLYIRPIPGLKAVEEAIGRATEMGKPILYCSGVADLQCPGVLASLTVLGWVSEQVATYGASLTYPVNNAMTLTAGQEIVKEGYLRAGRPELYHDDMVYFISGEQFAYAAAVCGVMERERPAANLFFGSYWSEALILTESGAATGAMQIAATDMEHQIPFMVATCDYVIIGEEFYAASAYLSEDPNIKSSLKAQDLIKMAVLLLILAGVIMATLANITDFDGEGFFEFFRR